MSTNAWALTTRARVMDFMGISSLTAVQENVLDRIIDSVTDYIEHYCGRRLKSTAYNEVFNGDGSRDYVAKHFPISTITSLQYRNSSANEDSWTSMDTEYYFYDLNSGVITLSGNSRFIFFSDHLYKLNYTAGFDFDNTTTFLSDVGGADLEYAVWKLCVTAFDKSKGEVGVESESIGDYSVTYAKTMFENSEIKEIIGKYKGFEVAGIRSPQNY
jgi:hypothetical protein